jgi:hypothetical protein
MKQTYVIFANWNQTITVVIPYEMYASGRGRQAMERRLGCTLYHFNHNGGTREIGNTGLEQYTECYGDVKLEND